MHNGYDSRDPGRVAWLDDLQHRQDNPPDQYSASRLPEPDAEAVDPVDPGGRGTQRTATYPSPSDGIAADEFCAAPTSHPYDEQHAAPSRAPAAASTGDAPQPDGVSGMRDRAGAVAAGMRSGAERALALGGRGRLVGERVVGRVSRSVPARTVLFVAPAVVLPFVFDLSLGATIAVILLLLWLPAAAGVFVAMMLDGGQHLAIRALERRIDERASGNDEALLVIGQHLNRIDDRLAALTHPAERAVGDSSTLAGRATAIRSSRGDDDLRYWS